MSEKITLADQIYTDIKKDITNKQLVSGDQLFIGDVFFNVRINLIG